MMRKLGSFGFILTGLLFISAAHFAQSSWVASCGGGENDWPQSIAQTGDGGYLVAALYYSLHPHPGSLVRLDADGSFLWGRRYGADSNTDRITRMVSTPDGGAYLAGLSYHPVYYDDLWILRVDCSGQLLWQKRLTSTYRARDEERVTDLCVTADGGCIAVATSGGIDPTLGPAAWIVKLDAAGAVAFQKSYPDSSDYGFRVAPAPDGGCWLAGEQFDSGGFVVFRLNAAGGVLFKKVITGAWLTHFMSPTSDGGVILTGWAVEYGAEIVRLGSGGALIWARSSPGFDYCVAAKEAPDGSVLWVGGTWDELTSYPLLVRTTANGEALWKRLYPFQGTQIVRCAEGTLDGGCALTCVTNSLHQGGEWDSLIVKVGPEGELAEGCTPPVDGSATILDLPVVIAPSGATLSTFPYLDTTPDTILYASSGGLSLLCSSCSVDCGASAPASGQATIPVPFLAEDLSEGCGSTPLFEWDFGDGTDPSSGTNPFHTYTRAGTYTWTVTVRVGLHDCERSGVINIAGPPYDMDLYDDSGRSRLCANRATGAWRWEVLRGPGIGTYEGVGRVSVQNGVWTLASLPGEPWGLTARCYERYDKASGSFIYRAKRVSSLLVDSNSANNPSMCP